MLSRLSIIFLLALADLPVEAATLKGVILANELSGPSMENIEIDAASGTNHTVSDSSGKFTLEFPQRRAGEPVRVTVKKDGYEVVNDVQLEATLTVDPDAKPLIILLCKEGDREEMARRWNKESNSVGRTTISCGIFLTDCWTLCPRRTSTTPPRLKISARYPSLCPTQTRRGANSDSFITRQA